MVQRSFPVTWDELHRDTRALAWRLSEAGPFRALSASRGAGWCRRPIVARELELRFVETVCISSYDDREHRDPVVLKALEGEDGEGLLIVDDLVDTGVTARIVRAMLPKAHFATVPMPSRRGRPMVDTTDNAGEPGHLDRLPLGRRRADQRADRRKEERPGEWNSLQPATA